jgi:GTPase
MLVNKYKRLIRLDPESEEGSIEYKYCLKQHKSPKLYSQITYRINNGNGNAIIYLGVTDNGFGIGITQEMMDITLVVIINSLIYANAEVNSVTIYPGYYDEHYVVKLNIIGIVEEPDFISF